MLSISIPCRGPSDQRTSHSPDQRPWDRIHGNPCTALWCMPADQPAMNVEVEVAHASQRPMILVEGVFLEGSTCPSVLDSVTCRQWKQKERCVRENMVAKNLPKFMPSSTYSDSKTFNPRATIPDVQAVTTAIYSTDGRHRATKEIIDSPRIANAICGLTLPSQPINSLQVSIPDPGFPFATPSIHPPILRGCP